MNKILESVKQVKDNQKKIILLKHPVTVESIELKIYYLNGLSLLLYVDGEMLESERTFLCSMTKAFDFNDSFIEDIIAFGKEPRENQVSELLMTLAKSDTVKYCFIIDCYLIANHNEKITDRKSELIKLFIETLGISKQEEQDLLEANSILINCDHERAEIFYRKNKRMYELLSFYFELKNINQHQEIKEVKEEVKNNENKSEKNARKQKEKFGKKTKNSEQEQEQIRIMQRQISELEQEEERLWSKWDRLSDKHTKLIMQQTEYELANMFQKAFLPNPSDSAIDRAEREADRADDEHEAVVKKIEDLKKQLNSLICL
ncbi:MAG: hypothetical protein PHR06_13840 [Candidatus Cloacimonetes bacterium]|nr:hypothetical protein [Candidatus Cloacimonadota bacterium]